VSHFSTVGAVTNRYDPFSAHEYGIGGMRKLLPTVHDNSAPTLAAAL
jgi:hypothetical protein